MRESRTYGSVRGALREKRSYRDLDLRFPFVRLPILDADSSSMLMPPSGTLGEGFLIRGCGSMARFSCCHWRPIA